MYNTPVSHVVLHHVAVTAQSGENVPVSTYSPPVIAFPFLSHPSPLSFVATRLPQPARSSGVARNLIWRVGGVYVLTSHCNFKTRVNVPHVNKTVTDLGGVYILIYPPSLRPWIFTAGFSA